MKCPLFCIDDKRVQLGEETDYGDCLKDDCAWWDELLQRCVVKTLGTVFDGILYQGKEILEKMLPAKE